MAPVLRFPDPRNTGPEGLLALGGDLSAETLLLAYRQGIFPWPIEGAPALTWFCPPERGVIDFAELHIPRSLKLFRKKSPYRYSFDQAFERVIDHCQAAYRRDQPGTWITPEMREAYVEFNREGYAHSVEAWDTVTGELVGGLYGVYFKGAFAGESMFHTAPNASKLALLHLIDSLQAHGITWMDIQVMTPHMKALGAKLISRDDFLDRLMRQHAQSRDLRSPF
jgi:leucyl/phenylalanyl-tRNA--protein transferase